MTERETLAGIGSIAELRKYRRQIEQQLDESRATLTARRQQLTARITPTYILGYVATRTETVIAMIDFARRLYDLAQNSFARRKKG